MLKDADRDVRLRAITALRNLAGEVRQLLPTLRAALAEAILHDGDDIVRAEALRALLHAGAPPATDVAALEGALASEVEAVRCHAAIALGELGPEGRPAVPALIHACLWDAEPAVRVAAAMALWKVDQRKRALVLHVLTRALDNTSELICWAAAECLGQMGPAARDAVPALRRALGKSYRLSLITTSVRLALDRIDPQAPAG
jgi:HEAT repeat protein